MAHHYRFSFDLIYTKLHKTFVETLRDYLKIFLLSQIGFQSFGFSVDVPQAGQVGYHYNYEVMSWFLHNWNGRYHYTASEIKKHGLSVG